MTPDVMITSPDALLAFGKLPYPDRYFDYMFAHYVSGQPDGQAWYRALMMDADDWIQLRGNPGITPSEALWEVLATRERSSLPLPAVLIAGFLALVPDPGAASQRDMLFWISSGISDLLSLLPHNSIQADASPVPDEQLTQYAQSIIDAILHQRVPIPWPENDADGLTILLAMAAYLWTFPPNLVESLVIAQLKAIAIYCAMEDVDDEDDLLPDRDEAPQQLTTAALLRNISALRSWQTPPLAVRGIPVHMPASAYYLTWLQALTLTHPTAPQIDDADLEWLCEGTIGNIHQIPQVDFVHIDVQLEPLSVRYATRLDRIGSLQQEAENGKYLPAGKWTFQVNESMAVLSALHVYAVRLVTGPTGYWIRLTSHPELWGRVLWWQPEEVPPICLPLLFQTTRTSPGVMALHEALWELWRDLRVVGRLS